MNFKISSITQITSIQISDFALKTWGEEFSRKVLTEWWISSTHAETMVALDERHNRIAGIVVGVKSRWPLNDGTVTDTVSICGWYVSPEYAGQGVGRLLVGYFDQSTTSQNTIAITKNAVEGFRKLGWAGPFRSHIFLMPLPVFRHTMKANDCFSLASYRIRGDELPKKLIKELEVIEQTRPKNQIRRLRKIEDLLSHLSVWPNRIHNFHVLTRGAEPIGFFIIRETDHKAALLYRITRLSYVTDIVMNKEDEQSLFYLSEIIVKTAHWNAGGIILCTTCPKISNALTKAGWLSGKSPFIGKRLLEKAPLYMVGGLLSLEQQSEIKMTFSDSDVDLNL